MNNLVSLVVILFTLAFTPSLALAKGHGVFRVVKGDVTVQSGENGKTKKAKIGQKVYPKDIVISGKNSRAKIVMVDKNVLNISPDSKLEISAYEFEPTKKKKNVLLNVIYGKVRSKVKQKYDGKDNKFQVKTKSAVAGVRGTDFITGYNPANNQSRVVTFEGKVEFGVPAPGGGIRNPVAVSAGQTATQIAGSKPSSPRSVPKNQLAEMNTESDADSASGGDSNNQRQPASKQEQKKKGESKPLPPPPPSEDVFKTPDNPPPPPTLDAGCPGGVCRVLPPPPPCFPDCNNPALTGKANLVINVK